MQVPSARRTHPILPRAEDCLRAQVEMYPSKSDGMFVPESLIFRSDSNGEDLEGYAGAGLYDSITMDRTELKKVDYASDRCAPASFVYSQGWIRAVEEHTPHALQVDLLCKTCFVCGVSSEIMGCHSAKLVPWNLESSTVSSSL